jgi:phenylalanyl-tRNA synthetase beta chain
MAREGETLTTLDGERRTLSPEMPVIADDDGPVGLAGLMGGADSEISDDTVDVWLEAANFDAITVRRMARRLGMHTEASHRFERGADPELPPVAVDLAAALIAELAGGTVCRGRVDVCPRPWQPGTMSFEVDRLSAFAGLAISADEATRIFSGLGFAPALEGGLLTCAVPSWRVDIERIPDLYEEVIRHVGYDRIPAVLPILGTTPGRRNANWERVDRARSAAVEVGLAEAVTYAFVDPADDALTVSLPLLPGDAVELANPLASTQTTLRRSLLVGLLNAVRDNLNQGERDLALFEQGRVFATVEDEPKESERLAIAMSGRVGSWADRRDIDFGDLKGAVDGVLGSLGFGGVEWRRGGEPWLARSEGATLVSDGRTIGCAGRVAKKMADRWGLKQAVYVAELDLEDVAAEPALPRFEPLPRFPAVTVDMTVEHRNDVSFAELERVTRGLASEDVEGIHLVARYSGKGLPADAVRTTLRLVYRRADRSLTQEEVNSNQESLRGQLSDQLQVRFA